MCSKRGMGWFGRLAVAGQLCDGGRRGGILVATALVAAGLGGCRPPAPAGNAAGATPALNRAIDVRLVDHEALMATVSAARGRIVVLDCWSTSCPPCVKEFPGLVKLAAAHPDDVTCLSLSLDYDGVGRPEDALPAVRRFLADVGAGAVQNLLASEEADAMYRKLDLASVPAVYVWKADGTLATRFDDDMAARSLGRPFTYDDVEAAVRDLLRP